MDGPSTPDRPPAGSWADPSPAGGGGTPRARPTRWTSLLDRRLSPVAERDAVAEAAVEAAIHYSGAPMANIQFLHGDGGLRIQAHHGFEAPFLEFFRVVHGEGSACGAAQRTGSLVVVEDVARSAVFDGTPSLQVMLDAGARAVTSLPIVGRSGALVGVLSIHYDSVHRPSDHILGMVDSVAARVGKLL